MDLEIDDQGRVKKSSGQCTDPVFLEPTRSCLSIQMFVPATRNGRPVSAVHHMEYEWRSWQPHERNLCRKLGLS